MSAEKIIAQIKKDAEKESNQILKKANEEADNIKTRIKNEAESEVKKIIEKGKIHSDNIRKILISKAYQDIKIEQMNTKEKIIEECFTKAHHELSILNEKQYRKIVDKLIQDGLNKLDGKCNILISRDLDKDIVKKYNIDIIGRIEASGGIILKSIDNKIILDHTFDGILKREKDKIRIKVGKLLFS